MQINIVVSIQTAQLVYFANEIILQYYGALPVEEKQINNWDSSAPHTLHRLKIASRFPICNCALKQAVFVAPRLYVVVHEVGPQQLACCA